MKDVTLPLSTASAIIQALNRILSERIPAKYAFMVAKIATILAYNPDISAAETTRQHLVEKYGTKNDIGEVTVQPENIQKFLIEYRFLTETPVTVSVEPLPSEIVDHFPELSPAEAMVLKSIME